MVSEKADLPIVVAARMEAGRMRAAVAGREDAADVRMTALQFRTLASLIERLAGADTSMPQEFRSWVPLGHFEKMRRHAEACEADSRAARDQLTARETDNIRLTAFAFGLPHPA